MNLIFFLFSFWEYIFPVLPVLKPFCYCCSAANDVILSHMITFLNDKDDAQLRDSFYRNIVSVVAYIGWPSTQIIVPLLQQVFLL